MERGSAPSLLPILRSRQQGELLALLLGDPELEASLTDLAALVSVPVSSVHREIDRAESAGLVTSRKIGNTRLVRANTDSPYYRGLADVLVKAVRPAPSPGRSARPDRQHRRRAHLRILGGTPPRRRSRPSCRRHRRTGTWIARPRRAVRGSLRGRAAVGTTRASHCPAGRLDQHRHRQLPRHRHPAPAGGDRPQDGSNRERRPLSLIRLMPLSRGRPLPSGVGRLVEMAFDTVAPGLGLGHHLR